MTFNYSGYPIHFIQREPFKDSSAHEFYIIF